MWNRIGDAISTAEPGDWCQLTEAKLEAAAEDPGLDQQAEENTRAMLIGLFNSLDIEVAFTDGPPGQSE